MSIKKDKTGRWLVHIEKKGFKRIRKTFLTKKDAEQFEISVLSTKPVESVNEVTDQRRLAELVTLWFDYHGVNLSDGERRRDKLRVIALELGNPVAANLSIEAVVAWRADKLKKGISKKTCNNFVGYLLALFNTLVKYKVVGSIPAASTTQLAVFIDDCIFVISKNGVLVVNWLLIFINDDILPPPIYSEQGNAIKSIN